MAQATQKISLNAAREIPFNKLILSQQNVRKTKAGKQPVTGELGELTADDEHAL